MSSGGKNKIDLTNQKFGKLLVIKQSGSSKRGLAIWNCACDCGNSFTTSGYYLRTGRKKSCGCKNFRKRGFKNPKWSGYEEISGSYWHAIKNGASSRNLELEITIQDIWYKFLEQDRKCALTGEEITLVSSYASSKKDGEKQTASLDRIDSKKGYVKGNVQWVHKDINKIKMDLHSDYFIDLCRKVATYHAK
jgi:hypothetical protein